jgi:site-specific recombinase XerD
MSKNISYLFYLRSPKTKKAKPNSSNPGEEKLLPIYFRITVNGVRAEIATGELITAGSWNAPKNRAKGFSERAQLINAKLDLELSKAKKAVQRLEEKSRPISSILIKNLLKGNDSTNYGVVQCFEHLVNDIRLKVGNDYETGTLKNYQVTLRHLKEFMAKGYQVTDFSLKELNYTFITDFELMCKTVWNCKNSSTMKHIQRIRTSIRLAIANEWLDKDPFHAFKGKADKTTIKYLTQEELDRIIEKEFSMVRLEKVRDAFIFSCYTGYAFSEIKKFTPHDIVTGMDGLKWIYTERTKTKNKTNVPLLPQALEIIEKYRSHPDTINGNKLIPLIANCKVNEYLKEIADVCGIRKNLTFHMARHTFATTVTLTNGVPIETVSTMLGHKSLKTTQIYAKVLENKVSTDMLALRDKLKPIIRNSRMVEPGS